jgi:hypothetical protein
MDVCFNGGSDARPKKMKRGAPIPFRSLDLTSYDFFLVGLVQDSAFVPSLPMELQDLRHRIIEAGFNYQRHAGRGLGRTG